MQIVLRQRQLRLFGFLLRAGSIDIFLTGSLHDQLQQLGGGLYPLACCRGYCGCIIGPLS